MIRDDELLKVKVLIKAFLVCNPGKHTAGEIARWINSNNFGLVHGVTATEVGIIIKNYSMVNKFMKPIKAENRFPNGGPKEYYLEAQ